MPVMEFESLEALPEEFRGSAKKDDASGKFKIDVSLTSKVTEFRDNNIKILKERDDAVSRTSQLVQLLGADNPDSAFERAKSLAELDKKIQDKKLIEADGFDAALAKRTAEMQSAHKAQLEAEANRRAMLEKDSASLRSRIEEMTISQEVSAAVTASKLGFRPEAVGDILTRARGQFRVQDGKLVAQGPDGSPVYGEDALPLSVDGFLKRVAEQYPYYLRDNRGGDAGGGRGGDQTSGAIDKIPLGDFLSQMESGKGPIKLR